AGGRWCHCRLRDRPARGEARRLRRPRHEGRRLHRLPEGAVEARAPGARRMTAWFWKGKGEGEDRPKKVNIAEGLWVKCDSCKEIVYRPEVHRRRPTCPHSPSPFPI